jgi:cysteine desulfurase
VQSHLKSEIQRLNDLRDTFEREMTKLPFVTVNGDRDHRTCNTSNLCIEYTDSSALLMALDLKGIACSTGSACAAGTPDPSHVLLAMGLPQDKAHASLRFSFGSPTQNEDIEKAVPIIAETVNRLRETHPLWEKVNHHVQ